MLKLQGKTIYLRPLELIDADGNYPNWFNDPVVCKYNSHGDVLYTKEMAIEYINAVNAIETTKVFSICDVFSNTHIGNISLQSISTKNKSAEFAIIIGEKNFFGKGIGYEAGELILEYGFKKLNLHRIYCGTSQYNIPMQKLSLSLGMKAEGISVDAMIKNNLFIDMYRYAIINGKNSV